MSGVTNLMHLRPDRAPDFEIGAPDDPYMQRWYLVPRNELFNVYYHRILRDDDDRALHDHPWPSFSILLRGRIVEELDGHRREIGFGECVYRGAELAHRLELVGGAPAETLFITGPKIRDWGFHCPKGWVHWRNFVEPGQTGAIGRGCGEI